MSRALHSDAQAKALGSLGFLQGFDFGQTANCGGSRDMRAHRKGRQRQVKRGAGARNGQGDFRVETNDHRRFWSSGNRAAGVVVRPVFLATAAPSRRGRRSVFSTPVFYFRPDSIG